MTLTVPLEARMWRPWRGHGLQNEPVVYANRCFTETLKNAPKRSWESHKMWSERFLDTPGEAQAA